MKDKNKFPNSQNNKIKRKGVHAKTKVSSNKQNKNYSKPYNSQGK